MGLYLVGKCPFKMDIITATVKYCNYTAGLFESFSFCCFLDNLIYPVWMENHRQVSGKLPMRRPVERRFLSTWMRHNYGKWKRTGRQGFIKTEFVPANYYIALFQLKQIPHLDRNSNCTAFKAYKVKGKTRKESISRPVPGATSTLAFPSDSEKIRLVISVLI